MASAGEKISMGKQRKQIKTNTCTERKHYSGPEQRKARGKERNKYRAHRWRSHPLRSHISLSVYFIAAQFRAFVIFKVYHRHLFDDGGAASAHIRRMCEKVVIVCRLARVARRLSRRLAEVINKIFVLRRNSALRCSPVYNVKQRKS